MPITICTKIMGSLSRDRRRSWSHEQISKHLHAQASHALDKLACRSVHAPACLLQHGIVSAGASSNQTAQQTGPAFFYFLAQMLPKTCQQSQTWPEAPQQRHPDLHLRAAMSRDGRTRLAHTDAAHDLTLDFIGMLASYEVMEPG